MNSEQLQSSNYTNRLSNYKKRLSNYTNRLSNYTTKSYRTSKHIEKFQGYSKKTFMFKCDNPINISSILSDPKDPAADPIIILHTCGDKMSVIKLSYINDIYFVRQIKTSKYENYDTLVSYFKKINGEKNLDELSFVSETSNYYHHLVCESLIYKFLNRAIKYNITPHIVQFYGSKKITYQQLSTNMTENDRTSFKYIYI